MIGWSRAIVVEKKDIELATALARDLAAAKVDRNELGKAIDYFRRTRSKDKFFKLLDRLPRSGYVRSRRTRNHLGQIARACHQYLQDIEKDQQALLIICWSFRLITYQQTLSGQRYARNR